MPVFSLLALSLLCLAAISMAQSICSTAQNTNQYYNPSCTSPLSPYCTDTNSGMRCSSCTPQKTSQAICDCPANSYCDPGLGSPTYGTCVPFNMASRPCNNAANCPVATVNGLPTGYWSCIAGFCRPCNTTFYGTGIITCGGGWPSPQSSRPGETRQCGSDGYFIGGGTITVTSPSTTRPQSSGASARREMSSLLLLLAALALGLPIALGAFAISTTFGSSPLSILSILILLCLAEVSIAQNTCSTAQNTNVFYNPSCTSPLSPYCTDTRNGMQCSTCNPQKTSQAICDCPANSYCDPSPTSPSYGTCRAFPISGQPCGSASNCQTPGANSGSYVTWSCIGGFCRPCNITFYGTGVTTCGGGWPSPQSSRPGETRQCGSDGYFISGGAINVTNPSTTRPQSSGAPAMRKASLLAVLSSILLTALWLPVLCA